MKKLRNLGRTLSKQEQKRIIGGDYGTVPCSISVDCIERVYDFNTQTYKFVKVASLSCSGVGECSSRNNGVYCTQSDAWPYAESCPEGTVAA